MYKKLIKSKYRNHILLSLILVFALTLRLAFFTGIGSSDPLFYTEYADQVLKNKPNFSENIGLRIGLIYPVAILYNIFGINEFSSNIFPLLISLASIILIYKFGRLLFNERVGLLSAFLLSFFPLDVVHSTRLMADLPAGFFVALSIYFFLKSEKINKRVNSNIYCLFSGVALGISYLIKEISLLIILFFLIYVLYNKKIKSRYFLVALGFLLIFSVELIYFFNLTGDPFIRFTFGNSKITEDFLATNMYGRGDFPLGLFHYFYLIFTDNFLVLFYVFIFISIFYCIVNRKKETYSLLFWFIPLLLYLSFGTVSITQYVLIPAGSRMFFIINIPGILLLSYFLMQNDNLIKRILMPSIVILLLVTSIGYIYISDQRFSLDNERNTYKYLETLPEKQTYTDYRTIRIFNYLSEFKSDNQMVIFNDFNAFKPEETYALDLNKINDSYVVINWRLINIFLSIKRNIIFPDEIYNIPENWVLKKEIGSKEKDKIIIYYAP